MILIFLFELISCCIHNICQNNCNVYFISMSCWPNIIAWSLNSLDLQICQHILACRARNCQPWIMSVWFVCCHVNLSICERNSLRCILVPVVSPFLVYDYANFGYATMECRWLYSCSTWGKINMVNLADLKKSGSVLRGSDDRLPARLPNLDTDIKLSASSISGVPAASTIM